MPYKRSAAQIEWLKKFYAEEKELEQDDQWKLDPDRVRLKYFEKVAETRQPTDASSGRNDDASDGQANNDGSPFPF